jgi:hypothetical protein
VPAQDSSQNSELFVAVLVSMPLVFNEKHVDPIFFDTIHFSHIRISFPFVSAISLAFPCGDDAGQSGPNTRQV